MVSDTLKEEELLWKLKNDELYKDYLWAFCNSQPFTVRPGRGYPCEEWKFSLTISSNSDHQDKWTLNFLLKHRIPFFTFSTFFYEFKFFKKLLQKNINTGKLPPITNCRVIKSAPILKELNYRWGDENSSLEPKRSSSTRPLCGNADIDNTDDFTKYYDKLLEKLTERKHLLTFLQDNGAYKLFVLWMKIESCKDIILLSDDKHAIKEKKLFVFRLLQEMFKSSFHDKAKSMYAKAANDLSLEFFTNIQDEIMTRLSSYWLQRYLLHISNMANATSMFANIQSAADHENTVKRTNCKSSLSSVGALFENNNKRKVSDTGPCLLALQCDRNCGYPFVSWLTATYPNMVFVALFLVDISEYLEDFHLLSDRTLKLIILWKIFHNYFHQESVLADSDSILHLQTSMKNLTNVSKTNVQFIYNPFMLLLFCGKTKMVVLKEKSVQLIDAYWEEYCESDYTNYERSEVITAISPALSSVLQRRRELMSSSVPRATLLSAYSQKRVNFKELTKTAKPKRKGKKKPKRIVTKKRDDDSDDDEDDDDDFMEHLENPEKMSQFKEYIQLEEGRLAMNDLLLFLEIEIYFSLSRGKQTQRQQTSMAIFKTFFEPSSRKAASLPEGFVASVDSERPSSPILREAQQYVLPQLQESYKAFYTSKKNFEKEQALRSPKEEANGKDKRKTSPSERMQNMMANKGRNRRGSGRAQVSKKDRLSFFAMLSSNSAKSALQMNVFRRYLLQYEGSGFPRLDKDLLFSSEVTKFKELFNYLDEKSILKKIEVIIDVFLDSASPPWLQIDIPAELASKITQRFQQNFSTKRRVTVQPLFDNTIFDEAFNIVVKELLPFWSGYQKHLTSLHWNQISKKLTKAEKKQRRLKKEFNNYEPAKEPIQVSLSTNLRKLSGDDEGNPMKTVLNFSLKNGYEWKNVACDTNQRRRRGTFLTKQEAVTEL